MPNFPCDFFFSMPEIYEIHLCLYNSDVLNKKLYPRCIVVLNQMFEFRNIMWSKQSQLIISNTQKSILLKVYEVPFLHVDGCPRIPLYILGGGVSLPFFTLWGGGPRSRVLRLTFPPCCSREGIQNPSCTG